MVDNEVRGDLHSHAGHGQSVLPQPRVLEDVGQADQRYILRGREGERDTELSHSPKAQGHVQQFTQ